MLSSLLLQRKMMDWVDPSGIPSKLDDPVGYSLSEHSIRLL